MPYINFNGHPHNHPHNSEEQNSISFGDGFASLGIAHKLPIKVWGERDDITAQAETMQQAIALADHPLARNFVALMPDYHYGFGMPIGGVFAARGGVIPNAVGTDIGCGMMAARTNWMAAEFDPDVLAGIRKRIHERIPVGDAKHAQPQISSFYDQDTAGGEAAWDRASYPVIQRDYKVTQLQLGTLGGGNHFIEFQEDELGSLWVMLHSGSRGIGARINKHYHELAVEWCERWHANIPNKDLAFLPEDFFLYDDYLREMHWAMEWATANRHRMLSEVREALMDVTGQHLMFVDTIETHHNYAQMENWFGQNFLIHRKGAVRAKGPVIIPGSMGTASYICEGLNNPMSYGSCSHGAGRPRSRTASNKMYTLESAKAEMAHVVFGVREGVYDEMPRAYKDIHAVIKQESDLVRPIHQLKPLMVVKG